MSGAWSSTSSFSIASELQPALRFTSKADSGDYVARILVADDEPDVLFMTAYALRVLGGHEVVETRNGVEALDAARQLRPDLVVLDIKMPLADGISVCRGIRATPGMEATPVILLSAKGQRAEVDEGWAAGANDYIIKPYAPDVLVRRVTELLKGRSGG